MDKRGWGPDRVVAVPERTIDDCRAWAERVTQKHHGNPRRRIASDHDDVEQRTIGKMCEAAFGLMMGYNVDYRVRERGGDGHRDFLVKMNNRLVSVDVKGTSSPRAERMIWPQGAPFAKAAEILVFARAFPMDGPKAGSVFIPAFVMKDQFFRLHETAGPDDIRGFIEGTWFMHYKEMTPIEVLYAATRRCRDCNQSASFTDTNGADLCFDHSGLKSAIPAAAVSG